MCVPRLSLKVWSSGIIKPLSMEIVDRAHDASGRRFTYSSIKGAL